MPQQLVDISLDEVSLVDKGANQHAHIVLMKQATKREDGEDFPASAFAYVPDPATPSSWKLRLWDSLEDKETAAQVGRALAALGPGFRGQRVEIPDDALPGVKAKVLAAWLKVHPDSDKDDAPAIVKALSFNDASNEQFINQKIHDMMGAFLRSVDSVMMDPQVNNPAAAIRDAVAQFHAAVADLAKESQLMSEHDDILKKQKELVDTIAKQAGELEAKDATITQLTADLDEATAPPVEVDADGINKADLPEPVRKKMEAQEARIQKMEDDGLKRDWVAKCGTEESAGLLFEVAKVAPELADKVHALVKAAEAQAEEAGLLKSLGSDQGGESSGALEKVNKMAGDLVAKGGITHAAAVAKVCQDNPELYGEYRSEMN